MAIPTKEEFDDAILLLASFDAKELVEKYWHYERTGRESLSKFSRDDFSSYINSGTFKLVHEYDEVKKFSEDVINLILEKRNKINKSPAISWLNSQPAFKAAQKSLNREKLKYKSITFEDSKILAAKLPLCLTEDRFKGKVESLIKHNLGFFHLIILKQLSTYFYSHHDRYFEALKKREVIAGKAAKLLNEFVDLESIIHETEMSLTPYQISQREKLLRLFKRASLEAEQISIIDVIKPAKKSGNTLKGRLLVFNLWNSFKKCSEIISFRRNYTTLITHLMYLEGIENPVGQRAVEQMVQDWRDWFRKRHTTLSSKEEEMLERLKKIQTEKKQNSIFLR
jgi:hypothetical protein